MRTSRATLQTYANRQALSGAHVVVDLYQVDCPGRQFDAIPGVFDQFDRVVIGVGRVVSLQRARKLY